MKPVSFLLSIDMLSKKWNIDPIVAEQALGKKDGFARFYQIKCKSSYLSHSIYNRSFSFFFLWDCWWPFDCHNYNGRAA